MHAGTDAAGCEICALALLGHIGSCGAERSIAVWRSSFGGPSALKTTPA